MPLRAGPLHTGAVSSRVVVLGGCGAWPEADRACSGFVVEHDGFRLVLDLGYGTLPRLFALLGSSTGVGVDAVIVTHDPSRSHGRPARVLQGPMV
jgi:glyoxylase-like metal-dependent hydrolase (beta-lactamase superfamily II)